MVKAFIAAAGYRQRVVPYFEILMKSKTIHEATRNVISCPFRVISWIVLALGKTTRNQFRALPASDLACDGHASNDAK
jgi:hypothetical protein